MPNLIAVALLAFQLGGIGPVAAKPPDTASIEGVVFRAGNGEPLRKAQLTLTQVKTPAELAAAPPSEDEEAGRPAFPPIAPVSTEADGKFRFANLAPGAYRLRVVCNGYVASEYGKRTPNGPGTIITLASGQAMRDIAFTLQPAATVSGRIRDAEGLPITDIGVSIARIGYEPNGNRTMVRAATTTTDDRGEYRLFWVPPGRYYLSTGAPEFPFMMNRGGNRVQETTYHTTYYPGTMDHSRAVIIDVTAGMELAGMDIVVIKPVTYKIKGTVVDAATGKPPRQVGVSLSSRSEEEVRSDSSYGGGETGGVRYANGEFEVVGVLPGSYWLQATTSPDYNAPLAALDVASVRTTSDLFEVAFRSNSARVPVDISASDLTGVTITLEAGVRVPIQVILEGKPLSSLTDYEKIRISLWSKGDRYSGYFGQQGALTADGVGVIDKVSKGEYRVWLDRRDLFIKEASLGSKDMLDAYQLLGGEVPGVLRIVLSDKPGRVQGTLTDAQSKPLGGFQVVLIPEKSRFRDELYKTADTDDKGQFLFTSIAPGDYRVYAWEALEPYSYYDRELLATYQSQGKLVHINEGSQETVDVRLIPAPKP